jgi:type IV secretory pathway TraG/TraD family ATPase VirD4
MAEGGGSGITTLAVLQSLAQARNRWGEHAADAIWDAATVKLVLGGLGKYRDLDDVARLLGEIDELVETRTTGRAGERSSSTSVGTGVLLLRHTKPTVIDLQPWTARRDAGVLRADRAAVELATATGTEVAA